MADRYKDREAVRRQLGRDPKPFSVAARCPFGLPSVIENEPTQKMPTTFWLTCPALGSAISRIESEGGVRQAREEVGESAVEAVHAEHFRRYGVRVAGIGEGGYVKCLHAFTALHLSGSLPNPVAEWTLWRLEKVYPEAACCTSREEASSKS